jgi:hypothetical protein
MNITTQTIYNFGADPTLISTTDNALGLIVAPYVEAGYCPEYPTWVPELPGGVYPPTSGTYIGTKGWTDLTQAQQCVAQINAWANANPAASAYRSATTITQS